jgi:hypothetical protein
MVYMVGSDLESKSCSPYGCASIDLAEMEQVGSNDNLKVIVETGGANKDDWRTVQRHIIKQGNRETLLDLGNLNMGDPLTLQNFITWSITNYPADKYALILWDHGGGAIGGFGQDENHDKDRLTLPELKQALQDAYNATGQILELISFDACLMATVEVAYNVSPYGRYLVASEEIEPSHGWNYEVILQAIVNNPSIDGASLGQIIADGYRAQAEEWGNTMRALGRTYEGDKKITLSVVDLSKIPFLVDNLDTLSFRIDTDLQTLGVDAWIFVAEGRSKSEDYGNNQSNQQFTDMVDLKHLAENLRAFYQTEADALIDSINQAVVYKINGDASPNANSLSIFLPFKTLQDPDITSYNSIDFSTNYKTMVNRYVTMIDTQPPTFAGETLIDSTFSA